MAVGTCCTCCMHFRQASLADVDRSVCRPLPQAAHSEKLMQQPLLTASSWRTPCASGALSSAAWLTLRAYMSFRRFTARLVVSPPAGEWAAGPALPPQALPEGCMGSGSVKLEPGTRHTKQGGRCVCTAQTYLQACSCCLVTTNTQSGPVSLRQSALASSVMGCMTHQQPLQAVLSGTSHTDSCRPAPMQLRGAHLDPGRQGAERLPHKGPHQLLMNRCIPCSLPPAWGAVEQVCRAAQRASPPRVLPTERLQHACCGLGVRGAEGQAISQLHSIVQRPAGAAAASGSDGPVLNAASTRDCSTEVGSTAGKIHMLKQGPQVSRT